jgi:CheY-like chemotaxis protein/signal transduction histidine kinase/CHASE3 domain sensor protein
MIPKTDNLTGRRASRIEEWRRSLPLPIGSLVGVLLGVLAVGGIALFSYRALDARQQAAASVEHTLEVMRQLDVVLSAMKDAETGQRGYFITGEDRYLEPFTRAQTEVPQLIDQLTTLVADNPVQAQRVEALRRLTVDKFSELQETLELRRAGDLEGSLAIVRSDRGKTAMDGIRSTIANMSGDEEALYRERERERAAAIGQLAATTFGGAGLLIFLIGAAAVVMSRDYRHRIRQDWIRAAQVSLVDQVQGDQRIDVLADRVLSFTAGYVTAYAGALYVADEYGALQRTASYATPASDAAPTGLVSQAARENRTIHVTDVPDGYLPISSALGRSTPLELLIVPSAMDGVVNGVIELAFFRRLTPTEIEVVGRIADTLAVSIRGALDRSRLEQLLEETQRQAEELQTQQEELRVNNEELEEQSTALRESQARLEVQQAELEQTNSQLTAQADELAEQKVELERRGAELERSSRYKSEFLANMSHELRTPLNSSLILAKVLADNKDANLTNEQVQFARSIYAAGNDLLDLINDILDLSKIESGKVDVRPELVPLARVADALVSTFRPLAADKRIEFSVTIDPDAGSEIETDPQRLLQILKNLISNAVKFTDRGSVTVRIGATGDRLAFAVRDTGIGIAAPQHEVIFEAFRQADGTTNRKYGGTGLGLSISRDLARLLGGDITLESSQGQGSTFTLSLPRAYRPAVAVPASSVPSAAAQPPTTARRPPQRAVAIDDDRDQLRDGARVLLIVDDDAAFARILCGLAHEVGFQCLLASTAEEAVELAFKYRPTAVLLDMNLPDHSGLTVLDRLKRHHATRHIPVQVISVEDYAQTALEMGAVGYMLKPVQRERLLEALSKIETRLGSQHRSVLVVEDDARQRASVCQLLGAEDVQTVPVATAAEALEQLRTATYDCMVLDISLPDASGFELLETMAQENQYSFPPVIVYTGRSLSSDEEHRLRRYSHSIIVKGARSPERLLDEVTLFLHQVEANLPADRRRMLVEARSRDAHMENRNVLVVEDDVRNIFALSSVLEPRGAKLTIARNGIEALQALDESPDIDMVLMDIMMPEMDGYDAMRAIRRQPRFRKLPIIALTAKAMPDDQERCLQAGANDYISKPIDVEQLLSLIRVWMPR